MDDGSFLRKLQSKKMQPNTLVLDSVCPATRLLEKRRQMFEVQEALEVQKQEFARKEEIFKRREESLKRKDLQLQESLIRFSKFLQENDAKRTRAEKKAADEIKAQHLKDKEIKNLRQSMHALSLESAAAKQTLDKNDKYHHYLESVIEATDAYQEITELLQRYETLSSTHADLLEQQTSAEAELQSIKRELHIYDHDKADAIVVKNNRLAELKRQIETYDNDVTARQLKRDTELSKAAQATLDYGRLIMATHHLFQRCIERSTIAHAASLSPLDQLEAIGNFVSDLESTVRAYNNSIAS